MQRVVAMRQRAVIGWFPVADVPCHPEKTPENTTLAPWTNEPTEFKRMYDERMRHLGVSYRGARVSEKDAAEAFEEAVTGNMKRKRATAELGPQKKRSREDELIEERDYFRSRVAWLSYESMAGQRFIGDNFGPLVDLNSILNSSAVISSAAYKRSPRGMTAYAPELKEWLEYIPESEFGEIKERLNIEIKAGERLNSSAIGIQSHMVKIAEARHENALERWLHLASGGYSGTELLSVYSPDVYWYKMTEPELRRAALKVGVIHFDAASYLNRVIFSFRQLPTVTFFKMISKENQWVRMKSVFSVVQTYENQRRDGRWKKLEMALPSFSEGEKSRFYDLITGPTIEIEGKMVPTHVPSMGTTIPACSAQFLDEIVVSMRHKRKAADGGYPEYQIVGSKLASCAHMEHCTSIQEGDSKGIAKGVKVEQLQDSIDRTEKNASEVRPLTTLRLIHRWMHRQTRTRPYEGDDTSRVTDGWLTDTPYGKAVLGDNPPDKMPGYVKNYVNWAGYSNHIVDAILSLILPYMHPVDTADYVSTFSAHTQLNWGHADRLELFSKFMNIALATTEENEPWTRDRVKALLSTSNQDDLLLRIPSTDSFLNNTLFQLEKWPGITGKEFGEAVICRQ